MKSSRQKRGKKRGIEKEEDEKGLMKRRKGKRKTNNKR